ncbi:phosphate acyltransferase [Conexibacter sp. CPCC 206217]|uniref:phosphate acyltransferase n=1 Tax=Conexibacter sp. CPCC 206217 TaxID=3064574 RepID=UPI00271AB660|nr:phosphate acyltransferase [Conexibacter sp. CPCC 206217]MDO8211655.1 phosphate acyltransferase [Conexibacter sp. CPCC 206217]
MTQLTISDPAADAFALDYASLAARVAGGGARRVGLLGCRSAGARATVERLLELGVQSVEVFETVAAASDVAATSLSAGAYWSRFADETSACAAAAVQWRAGLLDGLAKCELSTATVLREVLREQRGSWFAHLGLVLQEHDGSAFVLADAGLNRSPSVEQLALIVRRAATAARRLGCARPLVGLVAHTEHVDQSVPGSALLDELRRGHGEAFARDGVELVGPIALDVALDPDVASAKGTGLRRRCDVVIVPEIVVGNVLFKAYMLREDCLVAGAVFDGERRAMAVPSRAASVRERVASLAFALAITQNEEKVH